MPNYYEMCRRYHGKQVRITCRDGKVHSGTIVKVSRSHVYLQSSESRNLGGYGYGYYGYGYRRPIAVPLAFVTGLVLGGLLFW